MVLLLCERLRGFSPTCKFTKTPKSRPSRPPIWIHSTHQEEQIRPAWWRIADVASHEEKEHRTEVMARKATDLHSIAKDFVEQT